MPTKKSVNIAQELRTSNHTSTIFLGGTQRPWMYAGPSDSTGTIASNEVGGSRRAIARNEQTIPNHDAAEKSVPSSISPSISQHNSARKSGSNAGQKIVPHEGQNERETRVPVVSLETNKGVRAQTTRTTEGSMSVQNTISRPPAVVMNSTEVFLAQSVVPSSTSFIPQVHQRDVCPPQRSTASAQKTYSRPLQTEQGTNTTPVTSLTSGIHSLQSPAQHQGHFGSMQIQTQAELTRTSSSAAVTTLSSASHALSATDNCSRPGVNINNQVQAQARTSNQVQPSNGHILRSMARSNENEPMMFRSSDGSSMAQIPGQRPPGLASTGSALGFLAAFDQHIETIRQRHNGPLNSVSEGRIQWVRNACQCDDLYFLLLHQIYCLWSSKRAWLCSKLGFGPDQEDGFRCLELLMVSNLALPPDLLELFGIFINSCAVLENEPKLKYWVCSIREFLMGYPLRWNALRQVCVARGSPPCTWEICQQLNFARSPVLQRACFNSLRRQLFPSNSAAYLEEITKIFDEDQKRFLTRLEQGTLGHLPYLENVKIFARYCNFVKDKYGQSPTHVSDLALPSILSPTAAPTSYGPFSTLSVSNSEQVHGAIRNMDPRARIDNSGGGSLARQIPHMSPTGDFRPLRAIAGARNNVEPNVNHAQTDDGGLFSRATPAGFSAHSAFTGARPLNNQQAGTSLSLFPPSDFRLLILANPDPDTAALHQAHLRSPCIRPQRLPESSSIRRYCYLRGFLLPPQIHASDLSFSSWTFEFPASLAAHLVKDDLPAIDDVFGQTARSLDHGRILTSIRCIQLPAKQESVDLRAWSALPTTWPECGFFSLNDVFIELRRKIHYRKDLPADVTSVVRSGENKLCFSYVPDPKEVGKKFAIALEVINISDHQAALDAPTRVDARTSLETIQAKLKARSDDDDEDLVMVDAFICIDLIDPFTSQVFETPARGISCLHRECFDLESFLQSRSSRNKNGIVSPDEWLCPICKRDARPTSLIIDEFLLQVRNQLVEQGRPDVRAILVKEDGSWEPKPETAKAASGNDGSAQSQGGMNTAGEDISDQDRDREDKPKTVTRSHAAHPTIIDLMDD